MNALRRQAENFIAWREFRDSKKNFAMMLEIVARGRATLI
jgi:hypothetical protein